jgi:hypothetical protein
LNIKFGDIVMEKNFDGIVYYTRRPVDRRKVEDKRFFQRFRENNEYLNHNTERRVKVRRQNTGDMLGEKLQKNAIST